MKKIKWKTLSLRGAGPDGQTNYSTANGCTIERYQQGFVVGQDGVLFWVADSTVINSMIELA